MEAQGLLGVLNKLYAGETGGAQRPPFLDIDKTCPSLRLLERSADVIRSELKAVLERKEAIPRYHEVSKAETYISATVDPDKSWRVFLLKWVAGGGLEANQARCPRTTALLQQIPGVLQAGFSILDAGKSIPAHNGPYMGYLRYHLPLQVPRIDPPSIRVKDQVHVWVDGVGVLFDDSWNHEVYNRSSEIRVVLIVDVMRPMGWRNHAVNWLVTRVLSRFSEEVREAKANMARLSQRPQ